MLSVKKPSNLSEVHVICIDQAYGRLYSMYFADCIIFMWYMSFIITMCIYIFIYSIWCLICDLSTGGE